MLIDKGNVLDAIYDATEERLDRICYILRCPFDSECVYYGRCLYRELE